MRRNPDAVAFIDLWLKMRAEGECDWGVRSILATITREFNFPHHETSLTDWLKKHRYQAYEKCLR